MRKHMVGRAALGVFATAVLSLVAVLLVGFGPSKHAQSGRVMTNGEMHTVYGDAPGTPCKKLYPCNQPLKVGTTGNCGYCDSSSANRYVCCSTLGTGTQCDYIGGPLTCSNLDWCTGTDITGATSCDTCNAVSYTTNSKCIAIVDAVGGGC